ncbi:hypothetical protein A3841_15765 [Pontibacter flavimaris]|uniref:Uncharacterized protein n=1 Tax=Pontibacter flavimaris TaxID=1797110 RepID=A0A1Q5PCA9_9BACT|nr:hypothetical protein A3841_15765 [Pontibacter flavimaris]
MMVGLHQSFSLQMLPYLLLHWKFLVRYQGIRTLAGERVDEGCQGNHAGLRDEKSKRSPRQPVRS